MNFKATILTMCDISKKNICITNEKAEKFGRETQTITIIKDRNKF